MISIIISIVLMHLSDQRQTAGASAAGHGAPQADLQVPLAPPPPPGAGLAPSVALATVIALRRLTRFVHVPALRATEKVFIQTASGISTAASVDFASEELRPSDAEVVPLGLPQPAEQPER